MRPFAVLNDGRPYGQQLKPFNFLLTCHVRAFGHAKHRTLLIRYARKRGVLR
jgi:hypothetical protein